MDVTFVLEDESTFCIEVGFFDSFQEIKEKVEENRGIPVDRQTLLFNGQVLQNEAIISDTDISEASRVQLLLDMDSGNPVPPPILSPAPNSDEYDELLQWITEMPTLNEDEIQELLSSIEDAPPVAPQTTSPVVTLTPITASENALPPWNPVITPSLLPTRVEFMVKLIMDSKGKPFSIEMRLDDTVLQLKEKAHKMKKLRNLEVNETEVRIKTGQELQDNWSMRDCGMLTISHVYMRKKLAQPDFYFGEMMKVMVVPKVGTQKIPIEVNCRSSVGDLRFELEKFHKHALPKNGGYFLTNKKNGRLMNELTAFNLQVEDGDTIEITT